MLRIYYRTEINLRKCSHAAIIVLLSTVLHTAGKHMEDSIVAAYVSLLVGTVIQHNMVIVFQFL
jgi:hypothetical protein